MKTLVLLGDKSPEREVSLRSGKAVAEALRANGHEVSQYDPADGYDGLRRFVGQVDAVFPVLHGVGGEDGQIQTKLEKLGFKYLGADSKISKLCFDKVAFKQQIRAMNIPTPAYEVVTAQTFLQSALVKKPYVLKPIEGGSTIDAFIIRDPVKKPVDTAIFKKYRQMLLEELIVGDEITVPVLGKEALPVIEIIPPAGQEFDYEHKYDGSTQELCPPKNIPENKQKEAREMAAHIHNSFGVRHLSRTDFMIDRNGKLWVLELNTIPGLTDQSLYPKAAAQAGIDMKALVQRFLDMVLT